MLSLALARMTALVTTSSASVDIVADEDEDEDEDKDDARAAAVPASAGIVAIAEGAVDKASPGVSSIIAADGLCTASLANVSELRSLATSIFVDSGVGTLGVFSAFCSVSNAAAAAAAGVEAAGASKAAAAGVEVDVPGTAKASAAAAAAELLANAATGGALSSIPGLDCAPVAVKKPADGAGALLLGLAGGGASKAVEASSWARCR